MLIKDNIESAGRLPTTAGSLALANNVTNRDAPLVARLRAAGAIILGKTNLSEWANIRSSHSISGWSAVGGQTHNPWALDRNACGSSSGSGAAVAAGLVRFAIGTETDGSVTCPASINGIVGLKPTVGLVSRTYIVPISHSQDTAGPMTGNVRDTAELLTVIAGTDPAIPATRDADRHKTNYAAALDSGSLKGKRIGVLRFASTRSSIPHSRPRSRSSAQQGAILVDIKKFDDSADRQEREYRPPDRAEGRYGEVSEGQPGADRLAHPSRPDRVRQSARAAGDEPVRSGLFEESEKTKGLADPAYKKARATSFTAAGPNGIDRLLKQY